MCVVRNNVLFVSITTRSNVRVINNVRRDMCIRQRCCEYLWSEYEYEYHGIEYEYEYEYHGIKLSSTSTSTSTEVSSTSTSTSTRNF